METMRECEGRQARNKNRLEKKNLYQTFGPYHEASLRGRLVIISLREWTFLTLNKMSKFQNFK